MRSEIDSEAIEDTKKSISYYEQKAQKGSGFESDFQASIDRVLENPLRYPILDDDKGYRRCLFSGFPYGLFFKIMNDYIYVIVVAHHQRKPRFWVNREPDS